jgi:hypothetical protein
MGNTSDKSKTKTKSKTFLAYADRFESYKELEEALRAAGLESSNLIVGVDFTSSNLEQGGPPYFKEKNLHSMYYSPNPYQQAISIMGAALERFDDDHLIPAYGFGDLNTKDRSVFSFLTKSFVPLQSPDVIYPSLQPECDQFEDVPCYTFSQVLERYTAIIQSGIQMSGPTSFGPLIEKAIEIVKKEKSYHILLIICDGAVTNKKETAAAIVKASKYPLSIVCIGVGKGPWKIMEEFDDELPERDFDNFQFVDFHKIMTNCENKEVEFAKHALQEIPDQFEYIRNNLL